MSIASALMKARIVQRGSFRLTGGGVSDFYIDVKSVYAQPKILRMLARALAKLLPKQTTCIVVTGHGGIPLGVAVSLASGMPLTLVREQPKKHGRNTLLDGYVPTRGDRVAIIDDVFTTGGSIRRVETVIKRTGARVVGRLVVVNRSGKKLRTVRSLVQVQELLSATRA